jgi:putative ABC transport system permease protein
MADRTYMSVGEAVRIATGSLWTHKLRTMLTLLGVVIGVMSVIAVVSIISGLNQYVAEKVFRLGADVFVVTRGPQIITNIYEYEETQKRKKLYLDDYVGVRDACKSCVALGASLDHQNAQVKYGTDYLSNSDIMGWTPEMPQLNDYDLSSGRHINQTDVQHASAVCTVGFDIADQLLPGADPIGKEIRVDTSECTVIGVGEKLGSVLGISRDNWVILPITTFQKMYSGNDSITLWGKGVGVAGLEPTMDEVRQLLRGRRHVAFSADDDFAMGTNASYLSVWSSISGSFFGVTIVISSISLIVGGIVIMNIMLVSVTERTREIGLRKSLGARQSDIRLQFLIESSTIACLGGAIGVFLGLLLAQIISWTTALPSVVALWSIVAGMLVSTSVGLFFGVYPASQAARLDPVVALRSE